MKNTAHDLGGKPGFGKIDRSQQENFTHNWEKKVFQLTLACGMLGGWNLDQSRHARERMRKEHYLNSSYYEHWLHGLELLLVEKGLVTEQELQSGSADSPSNLSAIKPEKLSEILVYGGPTAMKTDVLPKYIIGRKVGVKYFETSEHTRAPHYIRGKTGTIAAHHGAHIFPDEHSRSGTKLPAHLYSIRFEAVDIWGRHKEPSPSCAYVDVFEPYLEDI